MTKQLLKWPQSRTLIPPNAGQGMKKQELSFFAGRRQNGTAPIEKRLLVIPSVITTPPYDSDIDTKK
jgi:hypothetical protein